MWFQTSGVAIQLRGSDVATDELVVKECLCPCPDLGEAGVAVCVEVEEVEELQERDD